MRLLSNAANRCHQHCYTESYLVWCRWWPVSSVRWRQCERGQHWQQLRQGERGLRSEQGWWVVKTERLVNNLLKQEASAVTAIDNQGTFSSTTLLKHFLKNFFRKRLAFKVTFFKSFWFKIAKETKRRVLFWSTPKRAMEIFLLMMRLCLPTGKICKALVF